MKDTTTMQLNKRVLVMFLMIFSGAILPFSGLALHQATAHGAENLRFMAMGFHNVASIVFAVATLVHVKYNWKLIVNYVWSKKDQLFRYPREMVIAGGALAALLLLMTVHIMSQHL